MNKQDFLFELGCEDIPATILLSLIDNLVELVAQALDKLALKYESVERFATPRRLSFIIRGLDSAQPPRTLIRRGPSLSAAFDKNGTPTLACLGFARSCGVSTDDLLEEITDKGSWIYCNVTQPGQPTVSILPTVISEAIHKLPLPKPMRWGSSDDKFIRPVHWLLMLFGDEVVPAVLFERSSDRFTYGHRFHHPKAIPIAHPRHYVDTLRQHGKVMVSFAERKKYIEKHIQQLMTAHQWQAKIVPSLLEEVTALVEWPVVMLGKFAPEFLRVPSEALITSMQSHQKCFAITDMADKLQPHFIMVSNIESRSPDLVVRGNERVIHARLNDAAFFYQQDLKHSLSHRLQRLEQVIFQKELGSLGAKSDRVSELAKQIASQLKLEPQLAARAGLLSKCDLVSDMVHEFPELQGIMGYYYALHDQEPEACAIAIREHYQPRFSGDQLPATLLGCAVALADRLDTLVGIFGIQQPPTGDKDPFALRRAALGIIRILIEREINLPLLDLLERAKSNYSFTLPNANVVNECYTFILERLRVWMIERGGSAQIYNAVAAVSSDNLLDFEHRVEAVKSFITLPEAQALAEANKRVNNILKKSTDGGLKATGEIVAGCLQEEAEKKLVAHMQAREQMLEQYYQQKNYVLALNELASFKQPVDVFFDQVMIMVDDAAVKKNRLAILSRLSALFSKVADIAELQQ